VVPAAHQFDKSCLWRFFFIKNLACGAFFLYNLFFNRYAAFDLKFLILSTNLLVVKIAQHHSNSKTIYNKQRTAEGMPHLKPIDFDVNKHSGYFV